MSDQGKVTINILWVSG